MEGGLYHPRRPIQTHSDVFQILQCPTHIPSFHKPHLHGLHSGKMVESLYIQDDMGIHTKNDTPLHHEQTRKVLLHLHEHGLTVKLSKTIFNTLQMEFLSMIIGQGEVRMDPKKLDAIKEWKPPTTVKGIQSFTGFTNFYRKFILGFSDVVTPLNLLT